MYHFLVKRRNKLFTIDFEDNLYNLYRLEPLS
jgi:hypothetical protein